MTNDKLSRLREICLGLPEAMEDPDGVGAPAFKVRGKIFAMRHDAEGRDSIWCKAPSGAQQALVGSNPERFFVPPYVGHHGWVGVWLDSTVDWAELDELVEDSYRMTAPKRLIARIGET